MAKWWETFEDGAVYELTKTVENPDKDGRRRRDWECAKEFPQGMRLVWREWWGFEQAGCSGHVIPGSKAGEIIAANVRKVEHDGMTLLKSLGYDTYRLTEYVAWLYDTGTLSKDEFLESFKAWLDDEPEH